jgi:translocation and assembly module TamB
VIRLLASLLVYVVLAAAALTLTATEAGLRWAWTWATPVLPAKLKVSALHGRLLGPLRLEGLEYRDQERFVQVQHIEWDWRPWRLLTGVLDLTRLEVEGLRYSALAPGDGVPRLPESLQPPLELRLRQVQLQDLQYIASPGDAPVVIEQLGFRASTGLAGLRLQDIHLQAGSIRAQGAGQIRLRGDYPIQADLRGHWPASPDTSWQGSAKLQGSLRALDFELALLAPQPAQATGQFRWLEDRLELDGELGTQALAAWARWLKLPESGASAVHGKFRARYQGTQLQLLHADIRLVDQPMRIALQGETDFAADDPQTNLQLQWQALRWPLQGEPVLLSPAGQLELSGSPAQYRLQGKTSLRAYGATAEELQLAGTGGREQLKIATLQTRLAGGAISGQGRVDWSDAVSLALELKGSGLDPATIHPEWPGRLSLEGKVRLSWPEAGMQLQIERLSARGQLRGRTLDLNARARRSGEDWHIEHAVMRSGKTRLSLQGRYGPQNDLRATLDSPDLADLLPQASGRLQGAGEWRGTPANPQLSAKLRGHDLRYESHGLVRLELDAELDGRARKDSHLNLRLKEGRFSGIAVPALNLSVQGPRESHDTALHLETELGELDLQAIGKWTGGFAWQASVRSGELRPADEGHWRLSAPVEIGLSRERAASSTACWVAENARACLQGQWLPGAWKASGELRQLPLALLQPFMPEGFFMAGLLDADGTLEQHPGAEMAAQAVLALSEGEIRRRQPGGHQALLQLQPSRAELRLASNVLDIEANLNVAPEGRAVLALQLPWPLSDDARVQPLRGQVRADLPHLGFVSALIPELHEVSGRVKGELRISGTLGEPAGAGGLQLSEGALRLDPLGLRVEALTAQLRTDGRDGLRLDAEARSGGGDLRLQASTRGGLALSAMEATLRGTDALVYNTADARVYLSPDLKLKLQAREVSISGLVHVPRADITPRQYAQTGAVTTSADQVLVNTEDPTGGARPGWSVHSRVRLILGDAVHFDGLGLKARLAGELQLQDKPGELTTASGELRVVEGQYTAYGRELDVTTGRLLFTGGPLIDPAVDARAERQPVDNVRVGVQLRGPLKSPRVTLFSDPAMPDAERLSYLMFGTPLDSGAQARNLAITQAAYALGLSGGEALVQDIGMQLGADEVQIQRGSGEGLDSAQLVIGKYLSPRLYVSYGIGLFDAVRTLRLRYRLSPRWTLETESGTHSGGDLLYSIER